MDEDPAEIRPVRGLIHGAGVLADRKIVDQTDGQFDLVYDTKVQGRPPSLSSDRSRVTQVSDSLLVVDRPVRPLGSGGVRRRQRSAEQVGPATVGPAAALSASSPITGAPGRAAWCNDSLKLVFEKEGLSLIPLDAGARLVVDEIRGGRSGTGRDRRPRGTGAGPSGEREPPRKLHRRHRRPTGKSSKRSFAARSTWTRCRCWRRTSSTAMPFCRWRSSWNGWPKGLSTAIRAWSLRASTTCGFTRE